MIKKQSLNLLLFSVNSKGELDKEFNSLNFKPLLVVLIYLFGFFFFCFCFQFDIY